MSQVSLIQSSLNEAIAEDDLPLVESLLKDIEDLNSDLENNTPSSLLRRAVFYKSKKVVSFLLKRFGDINTKEMNSALHEASRFADVDIVQLLVERGADIDARDKDGQTPLCLALRYWREDSVSIVGYLVKKGADVNIKNEHGVSPLHMACLQSDIDVVQLLVDRGAAIDARDKDGETPLYKAVYHNHYAICDYLIEKGAEVNVVTAGQETPLHAAVYEDNESIVRLLIESGADIETRNRHGDTPLCSAVSKNNESIVSLLVESGADIETRDQHGETPLQAAAWCISQPVLRLLLESGADVNACNSTGQSAIQELLNNGFIFCYSDVIEELLSWGASLPSQYVNTLTTDNPTHPAVEVLRKHSIKLKCAKLQQHSEYEFNCEEQDPFAISCEAELKDLRGKRFGRHNLSRVFSEYSDPTYVLNKDLETKISSPLLAEEFPIFAVMLKVWFCKAKQRLALLKEAGRCAKWSLPAEVIHEILTYVSDDDLRNVIKAGQ